MRVSRTLLTPKTGSSMADPFFEAMKKKLLHANNKVHTSLKHKTGTFSRNSSVNIAPTRSKDVITGIFHHPKITKSANPNKERIPVSMKNKRKELDKILNKDFRAINWTKDFATPNTYSSQARTSLQAKSEFDSIVKDWITTNWLNVNQSIQNKPCHFLVHDKLMYNNLNAFDAVYKMITRNCTNTEFNKDDMKLRWKLELDKLDFGTGGVLITVLENKLKYIIKNIFYPFVKNDRKDVTNFNKLINHVDFNKNLSALICQDVKYNDEILSKLKNLENLNTSNDFTIIKDRDFSLIPSFDYFKFLIDMNKNVGRQPNSLSRFSILKYKSIFGNKVNDFQNLEMLKHMLLKPSLHKNPRFIILSNERETSLEYFRLLKLFNKSWPELKLKGSVIYLNQQEVNIVPGHRRFTGKEMYYVINSFSEVYDILEVI